VVYDADVYTAATAGDCPDTVNPSLWRQSQLTSIQGLFEVTDGIYQLRGLDLSNMTLVEGDTGVIVIDPAVSAEVAAAGLALYRAHRGERPVRAVIYTHSHIDHFGGVLGVVDAGTDVPIVAPAGFLEHAVSENVYAGTAMTRRGVFHTGMALPVSATGTLGVGLGPGTSMGTAGLIAPTLDVTHTGQEVTHNLHNLLTLRGAEVRDARGWSRYINEAIELFTDDSDVAFASHHWPTWGTDDIVTLLRQQRDLYALASHAVFAEPTHAGAKALLGEVFTRLGHGSECGTWRNNFLTGAQELDGPVTPIALDTAGLVPALTVTITLTKPQLLGMLAGEGANGVQLDGDPKTFTMIASLTDQPDPNFTIVTP
jgi:alkyl sulfatase BDS1-like metallo-beta-lactamase superfamily hydrolase